MNTAGAILIGGRSSRMGEAKHAIALQDGRTMLDYVIAAMKPVCDRLVVVDSNANAHGFQSAASEIDVIADLRRGLGPLGGIEALLASGIDEHYLVCPCDVPRVTAEVFRALLAPTDSLSTVLRIEGSDMASPLPARISTRALPIVREMLDEGERAVHRLHARLDAHVIDVPHEWKSLLANVNTPGERANLPSPLGRGAGGEGACVVP